MEELDTGWQLIKGTRPILIVAGHNFEHGRSGEIKFAEWGTGEITRELCQKLNCWGLVATREQLDPNWYFDSPFREKVREIIMNKQITLVVDVHGSSMADRELIYLRINRKFKETYKSNAENLDTRKFLDNNQLTLSEEWDDKVPAVEIEVREDGRISTIDEENYKKAQKMIIGFIDNLL